MDSFIPVIYFPPAVKRLPHNDNSLPFHTGRFLFCVVDRLPVLPLRRCPALSLGLGDSKCRNDLFVPNAEFLSQKRKTNRSFCMMQFKHTVPFLYTENFEIKKKNADNSGLAILAHFSQFAYSSLFLCAEEFRGVKSLVWMQPKVIYYTRIIYDPRVRQCVFTEALQIDGTCSAISWRLFFPLEAFYLFSHVTPTCHSLPLFLLLMYRWEPSYLLRIPFHCIAAPPQSEWFQTWQNE